MCKIKETCGTHETFFMYANQLVKKHEKSFDMPKDGILFLVADLYSYALESFSSSSRMMLFIFSVHPISIKVRFNLIFVVALLDRWNQVN